MLWAAHATSRLAEAGYRSGAARRKVVDLLSAEPCAVTALDLERRLPSVGRASIYRTLEQLEQLHLVQRVSVGSGAAGYERLDPEEHHHHLLCEACGRLDPFADSSLERAIEAIGQATGFEVAAHDVVLRGTCSSCSETPAGRRA